MGRDTAAAVVAVDGDDLFASAIRQASTAVIARLASMPRW